MSRRVAVLVAAAPLALSCSLVDICHAGALASKPGQFEVSEPAVTLGSRAIHARYVTPATPRHRGFYIVFGTGDGGWRGTSADVLAHLATEGYAIAGFSAPEVLAPVKRSGELVNITRAAELYAQLFAQAKQGLGVPPDAKLIVAGFSRGASMVAFVTASRTLRQGLAGGIAMALTRETDYLLAPEPADRLPEITVDEKGRMQIYPALKTLAAAVPLAVIQSTRDHYVPSAESRKLLGPDTPTLRLYEVESGGHTFSGGRDALLRDLDDALAWIETTSASR